MKMKGIFDTTLNQKEAQDYPLTLWSIAAERRKSCISVRGSVLLPLFYLNFTLLNVAWIYQSTQIKIVF